MTGWAALSINVKPNSQHLENSLMQVGTTLAVDDSNDYAVCRVFGHLCYGLRMLNYAAMTGPTADRTQFATYFMMLPDCSAARNGLRHALGLRQ